MSHHTANCVICAQEGKRRTAKIWSAYVLLIDSTRKVRVTAGRCKKHANVEMAHLPHLSTSPKCVGLWIPDMGVVEE
jgi:hypothetical protein